MGRILQVRVLAYTYRAEDVVKAWPKLAALAFGFEYVQEARKGGLELEGTSQKGVLDIIRALNDGLMFDAWAVEPHQDMKEGIAALEPGVKNAMRLIDELESFLADWRASEANQVTVKIEDALDALERQAPSWIPAESKEGEDN